MNVRTSPAPKSANPPRSAGEVDLFISARVRERRLMLGLSQADLAKEIGITAMQLHKYEKGTNRIAAARLFRIARVLGVDVGYFYEGLNEAPAVPSSPQRLLLLFTRTFGEIRASKEREAVCSFVRELVVAELALERPLTA